MVLWGADNCEPFGPHELWEKGRNPSQAVAGDTVGGSSSFELCLDWQREEASTQALHVIQKLVRDAMVSDLEHTPSLACMANKLKGIWVPEINDWHGLGGAERIPRRRVLIQLSPCIRVRQLLHRAKVKVFVVKVDRVGFKGIGESRRHGAREREIYIKKRKRMVQIADERTKKKKRKGKCV